VTEATAPHSVHLFLVFAFAYFFSALLRAVIATLAPVLSADLSLRAADLGLLAGAFFFGFAVVQLPLGWALDRYGPRRTLICLLLVAVLGCSAFALAPNLLALIAARALIGVGLAACLMAALTSYRRWYSPMMQLRANSWMLMSGSLGMLASTLPVQWLLPHWGWRGLFWALAAMMIVATALVAWVVPPDAQPKAGTSGAGAGYRAIARHPLFVALLPLGFFSYGGLLAIQTLWAGPWLTRVCGWSAGQAAQGLFLINLVMLVVFMTWGAAMPGLTQRGWSAVRLLSWGLPLSWLGLAAIVALGAQATAVHWALWCAASSFVTVSQPAVGAAFPASQAGRALSAYNLVIFGGVFVVQWGLGLLIDLLQAAGQAESTAFRTAMAAYAACCALSYLWFVWRKPRPADNQSPSAAI
jgi:MFS family permease